ncbi:recombinase family protein [Tessaracoccus caeni]|uniref:recombinase family protein n=1 Tax=Tessaracoccus caeni TaxID=3031239 RepID=UPI0023DCC046|nr:recombinase family protein [Tessaracoccus caeni]MDF1487492.1 recombinase family protein [Tessaracoccus caeni]
MTTTTTESPLSPLRAVSYVRVSTLDQARRGAEPEGLSIPAQREANRRRALEMGALVVAEFVERGRSGRSIERPELRRMLEYIQDRPVDFVIVHKIDRLARNRADDAVITKTILGAGAYLVSTTEAISTTPSGRLLHGIMASIAEFYSQNLATEVMKGMRQKAIQGGTPGRAPLGYLNERRFDDGHEVRTITVDPERAEHVVWAFNAYATGEWSVTRLTAELESRGLTTRPGPNTPAQPLTVNGLHRVLRHPYYKGVVVHNGVEHPGRHKPLIDPVTWATVQDILTSRRNGERSREHDHYLKGTVFCIECGRRLIMQHTRTKTGRVYEYYVCHRHREATCLQRKVLPIAQVEQRVEDLYRTIELNPRQRVHIEQIALAKLHRQQAANDERLTQITVEAQTVNANQVKLLEAYYADAINRELFLTHQRRLNTEQTSLVHERAKLESENTEIQQRLCDALDLLQDVHATYADAPATMRKQLNRAIFAGIFLGPEPGQIRTDLNEPFATITQPR